MRQTPPTDPSSLPPPPTKTGVLALLENFLELLPERQVLLTGSAMAVVGMVLSFGGLIIVSLSGGDLPAGAKGPLAVATLGGALLGAAGIIRAQRYGPMKREREEWEHKRRMGELGHATTERVKELDTLARLQIDASETTRLILSLQRVADKLVTCETSLDEAVFG